MTLGQIIGAALILLFLGDVFLTVLYARAGTGWLAPYWNRAVWALLRATSRLFGRRQGAILSLAGPLIVVSLIGFWALGLTVGAALVIRPELGVAIKPSNGDTPTDLITALLVAGSSLSIVEGGDYAPHTAGTRILFLVNSLIGASVLSLVLSYLVQVYSALRERNTLALTIHLMTASTGDAAEMLARLGLNENCSDVTSELSNLARALAATKEAHHFYPLLFYFRFEDPLYSVSRFSFIVLDLVTLIGTALDQRRFRSLARSGPVASLRQCALLLLSTLDRNFPTGEDPASVPADTSRTGQSYAAAIDTLGGAGVAVQSYGMDRYVAERRSWEPIVRRIAPALGYGMDEIDRRQPHSGGQARRQATIRTRAREVVAKSTLSRRLSVRGTPKRTSRVSLGRAPPRERP